MRMKMKMRTMRSFQRRRNEVRRGASRLRTRATKYLIKTGTNRKPITVLQIDTDDEPALSKDAGSFEIDDTEALSWKNKENFAEPLYEDSDALFRPKRIKVG